MLGGLRRNAVASYFNMIVSILGGIIAVSVIEAHVGKAYFGVYQFVFSITAYATILDLGLTKTVERYTAKYNERDNLEKESSVVSMVLSIYTLAFIVLLAGVAVLYVLFPKMFHFTGDEMTIARTCLLIAGVNASLNVPAMTFRAHLKGHERYAFVHNLATLQSVMRIIMVVILMKLDYSVVSLFVLDFVLYQSTNIVTAFMSIKKYRIHLNFFKFDRTLMTSLISYSAYVLVGGVAELLYWSTDNILLGVFTDAETIAEYGLSQRLVNYFMRLGTAFSGLFFVKIMKVYTRLGKDGIGELAKLYTDACKSHSIIISLFIVNFFILGKDFIFLWVGDSYNMTYTYAVIILIPLWVILAQVTGNEVLYVMKKHGMMFAIQLSAAILNIVGTVVLLQKIGPLGAAISTSVSLVIGDIILLNLYYKHTMKLKLMSFFVEVYGKNLGISLAVLVLGYYINRWLPVPGFLMIAIKGMMVNLIYLPLIYLVLLRDDQKEWVQLKLKGFLTLFSLK